MLNKRIIFILSLFIITICTLSFVSANDLTEDNISNDEMEIEGIINLNQEDIKTNDFESDDILKSSDESTFTALQNKIDKASAGSIIYLDNDYSYNTNFGSIDGVKITKSLTINGNGHAIDGKSKSALLQISNVENVILNNIVFKNGFASKNNDVLVISNADYVKVNSCNFVDNYGVYGGALCIIDTDICSIESCAFDGNQADCGGAIFLMDICNSSINDCSFNENLGDCGGATYFEHVNSTYFEKCIFKGNGGEIGGAIFLYDGISFFVGCSFVKNYGKYGGAILLDGDDYSQFDSCNFTDNTMNVLNGAAGAIYTKGVSLSFIGCNFNSNKATKGNGGVVFSQFSQYCSFDLCNFTDNYAAGPYGGVIYLNNTMNCQFRSCNFYRNRGNHGGTLFIYQGNLDLKDSVIDNSFSYSDGGVLAGQYSNINVDNCIFTKYYSITGSAGAIYNFKGNLNVTNSSFIQGTANYGSAISSIESNLTVMSSEFVNNSASIGGAIYGIYGTINVDGSLFINSDAGAGGAICCIMSDLSTFTNNIFLNSTQTTGSAVYVVYPNGNVIERRNHYEDVYHIYYVYTVNVNGEKVLVKSNIVNYVLSNTGTYLNRYGKLESNGNHTDSIELSIYDVDYPNNSTIFEIYDRTYQHIINLTTHFGLNDELGNESLYFCIRNGRNDSLYAARAFDIQTILNGDIKLYYPLNNRMFDVVYMLNNIAGSALEAVPLLDSSSSNSTIVPPSYDSRDYGYITEVKDQGNAGNCWAFAGLATLEACIKKITGLDTDFSEENAKNLMAMYSNRGMNLTTNYGGYDTMIMAYLASWLGPINDTDEEDYDVYSILSTYYYPMIHVQNIKFLPARQNNLDNDLIKRAIMDYGAVAVTFNWDGSGLHAVSLVGWDDNYNKIDSLGKYAKGAWIFKNSWGNEWGDNGFGYLSYNTPFASEIYDHCHAYTFVFNENDNYIYNYQYDDAGVTDYLCSDGHVYYANKFLAHAGTYRGQPEYLSAFSTYFKYPTDYKVSIYINETLVLSQSGYSDAGYYTIPFNERIIIPSGEEFVIMIENMNEGKNYFPVCQVNEITRANFEANSSFFSYDGKTWYDLFELDGYHDFLFGGINAHTSQVACIKVFTSLDELYSIDINVSKFYDLNVGENVVINVTFNAQDYYFNSIELINNTLITLNINGNDYYAVICDGKASLNVNFDNGDIYTLRAQYKNNVFASNIVEFNFAVNKKTTALSATSVTKVYGGSEKSTVTLKDGDGNLIKDAIITFNVDGKASKIKTNAKGQAITDINLAPKTYTATVTYDGNGTYSGTSKYVKIVVKKATPKITASKKTFKSSVKTKKYTITLKNNLGKAMKNTKVTININGKTYSSKTNSKGQATFKITKLIKKGSFKATIKYAGSNYYNAVTKQAKITVR